MKTFLLRKENILFVRPMILEMKSISFFCVYFLYQKENNSLLHICTKNLTFIKFKELLSTENVKLLIKFSRFAEITMIFFK